MFFCKSYKSILTVGCLCCVLCLSGCLTTSLLRNDSAATPSAPPKPTPVAQPAKAPPQAAPVTLSTPAPATAPKVTAKNLTPSTPAAPAAQPYNNNGQTYPPMQAKDGQTLTTY